MKHASVTKVFFRLLINIEQFHILEGYVLMLAILL